jgi:REP element-mobilizing transposase RayT
MARHIMKPTEPVQEKHHRLSPDYYLGRTVSFTTCLSPRRNLLADPSIVTPLQSILIEAIEQYACDAAVYLFMPDHLHATLVSRKSDSHPLSAMKRFKQRSAFHFAQSQLPVRWQKDFYDHILRSDEDLIRHVRYTLNNPVRAKLIESWKLWPYKGSTLYEMDTWEIV